MHHHYFHHISTMNPQPFSLTQPSSPTARVVKAAGSRIAGEPSAEAAGNVLKQRFQRHILLMA
jgi:hypothetical protein